MRRFPSLLVAVLALTSAAFGQNSSIDLSRFGYIHTAAGHSPRPSFSAISYIGQDKLFVTFPAPSKNTMHGEPFDYNAVVLRRDGSEVAHAVFSGLMKDQLQLRFGIQPETSVLIVVDDELKVYDHALNSSQSFKLPKEPQLRLSPDRKTILILNRDGNEAFATTVSLPAMSIIAEKHLAFDERAVRDSEIAVSNKGAIAHAVGDPGAELSVSASSVIWPSEFALGKYQAPLAFIGEDNLLVSAMATTPFPPTHLYLWHADSKTQRIRKSSVGFYSHASQVQPSIDAKRILTFSANVNLFSAMLGGFDCGNCGESYYYSVIDIPSATVLFKRPSRWNCTQALSPHGNEIAELCDGIIHFVPIQDR